MSPTVSPPVLPNENMVFQSSFLPDSSPQVHAAAPQPHMQQEASPKTLPSPLHPQAHGRMPAPVHHQALQLEQPSAILHLHNSSCPTCSQNSSQDQAQNGAKVPVLGPGHTVPNRKTSASCEGRHSIKWDLFNRFQRPVCLSDACYIC